MLFRSTSTGDVFAAKYINFVATATDSKLLKRRRGPCVIISASGMCEGGRVLHHLKHAIEDEANIIAIVGFQAEHTLGRKLVEEWDTVPIFWCAHQTTSTGGSAQRIFSPCRSE